MNEETQKENNNGLAFFVYDRSSSVRYDKSVLDIIRNELTIGLQKLFSSEIGKEVIAIHEITDNSSVIPRYIEFNQICMGDKNGTTMEKSDFSNCVGKKKMWIKNQVDQVLRNLAITPTAKATDVFGIFRSVQLAMESGKASNKNTYVYVFSDLNNTADKINLSNLNNTINALQKAESVFNKLTNMKYIKPLDADNCVHFMIINPTGNVVKGPSIDFWEYFLTKWGVRPENIQWR